MKKYFNWEYSKRVMYTAQTIVVIFGIVFTAIQVKDINNNQLNRKNDLSMRYYEKLESGTNKEIFRSIDHKKPILIKNHGKFNEDDLDKYLGDLHDVGESLSINLLTKDDTCSRFSYITEKTWANKEIQEYILETRKEDPKYFLGFDSLYDFTKTCE